MDAFVDKNDKNASTGVYLASQVDQGGCDIDVKEGIYLWINIKEGVAELCLNYSESLLNKEMSSHKTLTQHRTSPSYS